MKRWDAQQIAHAAGAQLLHALTQSAGGPDRAVISSNEAGPGALFFGLAGERAHGGTYAASALSAGAWGVLTTPQHAGALLSGERPPNGVVLAAPDPLAALQRLATAWRRALGAKVIGVTGSTGKTSTKDLLFGVLSPYRMTVASQANFNTEIGLPLQILAAPAGTEVLVLEMGMRGPGQIAQLARIAEPDVGVIVTIGPVHLELLGTIENIAAAKAELIAALPAGATAVIPAAERLLDPHRREDLHTVTFGEGGDVHLTSQSETTVEIDLAGRAVTLEVDFTPAHLRSNLLAAVAAAHAIGVTPGGHLDFKLSPGRGQSVELGHGITLLDDAYNANPTSMRAALAELAATAARQAARREPSAPTRRVAVLGEMRELGPEAVAFHRQLGTQAAKTADLLVTVGPLAIHIAQDFPGEHHHVPDAEAAAQLLPTLLLPGDVVLVKASNGVGLKLVCETLTSGALK